MSDSRREDFDIFKALFSLATLASIGVGIYLWVTPKTPSEEKQVEHVIQLADAMNCTILKYPYEYNCTSPGNASIMDSQHLLRQVKDYFASLDYSDRHLLGALMVFLSPIFGIGTILAAGLGLILVGGGLFVTLNAFYETGLAIAERAEPVVESARAGLQHLGRSIAERSESVLNHTREGLQQAAGGARSHLQNAALFFRSRCIRHDILVDEEAIDVQPIDSQVAGMTQSQKTALDWQADALKLRDNEPEGSEPYRHVSEIVASLSRR